MADLMDQTTPESAGGMPAGNRALSVMDRVREAILGGAGGAGERLNEVQLSKTLSVSRTPVRAALQALAGEGLLDYAPNRGFTVREFPLPAHRRCLRHPRGARGCRRALCGGAWTWARGKGNHRARARRRR